MLTAIGDVMREMYARRWITTRDGNASVRRTGAEIFHITPSGWRKGIIHPEHLVKIGLGPEGPLVPEGTPPSGELHLHYRLLRDAPKTRAVVHGHPTHITAALYRGFDLQELATQFPEIFRYTRVGPTVPALPAISRALGDATVERLGLGADGTRGSLPFDIVGQANHGVTAVAQDPWAAFEHIERLDHVCEIVLASGVTPEEVKQRVVLEGV